MGNIDCKPCQDTHQTDNVKVESLLDHNSTEPNWEKLLKNRVQVEEFPTVSVHVMQKIKKHSKFVAEAGSAGTASQESKIWKVKPPINIYYSNRQNPDTLPLHDCIIYKMKDNGDFAGYFEGKVDAQHHPIFEDCFVVFHNASAMLGLRNNQAIYTNQVAGLRYEGGWQHEQPEGHGKEKCSKGTYEGEYHLGKKEGSGRFVWTDGAKYEGQFKNGLMYGHGVLSDEAEGYNYQGEFVWGLKSGKGKEKTKVDIYQGEFRQGKRCGQGQIVYLANQNRKQFNGWFEENVPHGRGVLKLDGKSAEIVGIWETGILKVIL